MALRLIPAGLLIIALYLILGPRVAALPAGLAQGALAFALYFAIGLAVTGLPALLRRPVRAN